MGLYKRGKTWWIDYYNGTKRVRENVGSVKDDARIILSERLKDIRQGRDPELRRIKAKPFREIVEEFMEGHVRQLRDKGGYRVSTKVLLRHLDGKTLQEITPAVVQDFVTARLAEGVCKSTVNRQRSCLSRLFNYAKERGCYGGDNPVKMVKAFPEPPGRFRYLTPDEAGRLVECAARHLRRIIITALHTGGRLTEVLRLKPDDIDLDRGVLYFDQTNTKSGKQREIPIDPTLDTTLRSLLKVTDLRSRRRGHIFTWKGEPVARVATAFTTARKRAGLGKDVTFHTLRHTFASWFVQNGGDLYRLQKYLGHSDIKLTQRYAHLSKDYLKAGIEFFGPPSESIGHKSVTNRGSAESGTAVTH